MTQIKPKVIILVGATGSGKSALAVELAKKFNGEVISADSRQIYRKLDIGTAKITKDETSGVSHHLIDILDIEQTYTAAHFKKDAARIIADIHARGNVPIVTGGTFFYLDTLLGRISAPEVAPNSTLRTELETKDLSELNELLLKLDPRRAATIDPHNKRRLIRALEIAQALGSVPLPKEKKPPYTVLILGLEISKDELRDAYRVRAQAWLKAGFINEVQTLLKNGVSKERLSEMGFEYQLGMRLADGTLNESEFIETFIQKNWQYAKRQRTWLKRDKTVHWVSPSEKAEIDLLIQQFLLH